MRIIRIIDSIDFVLFAGNRLFYSSGFMGMDMAAFMGVVSGCFY